MGDIGSGHLFVAEDRALLVSWLGFWKPLGEGTQGERRFFEATTVRSDLETNTSFPIMQGTIVPMNVDVSVSLNVHNRCL